MLHILATLFMLCSTYRFSSSHKDNILHTMDMSASRSLH